MMTGDRMARGFMGHKKVETSEDLRSQLANKQVHINVVLHNFVHSLKIYVLSAKFSVIRRVCNKSMRMV